MKAPPSLRTLPIAIAITALAFGITYFLVQRSLRTQGGDPSDALLVHSSAGDHLVLVDRVSAGGRVKSLYGARAVRLSALDARTGTRVGMRILDELATTCAAGTGATLWCADAAGGLLLLHVPGFATLASTNELVAGAGLGKPVASQWKFVGGDVVLLLPDLRGARIDSTTLAVEPADGTGIHGSLFPTRSRQTKSDWKLGAGYLVFGDGPRHPLLVAPRNYGALPPIPPSAPTFLMKDNQPQFLVLPGPSPLFVLSQSSLDPSIATSLVSRVDATPPREVWRADIGGRLQSAEIVDGALVLATQNAERRVMSVDLETGKIRWTFAY